MVKINKEPIIFFRNKAQQNQKRFLQNNEPNHENGQKGENAKETTFLFIGTYAGDEGFRPLPPDLVFWRSPDIEIYKDGHPVATNNINQGEEYQIVVTVTNNGDMNCPNFNLELFFTNPSLGFNLANATLLGIKRGSVNRHSQTDISFDIIATGSFIGHRCLFARVVSTSSNEFPLTADGLDAINDRHVAQHNIHVIQQENHFTLQVNHTKEIGKDAILQINIQKYMTPYMLNKLEMIKPDNTLVMPKEAFQLHPFSIKKVIGVGTRIFDAKPTKLLNLNQLNINAVNAGINLTPNLISHSLNINNTRLGFLDKNNVSKEIVKDREAYKLNQNLFHLSLEKDSYHEISFEVPNLNLKPGEVSVFDFEMRNPINNAIIGGTTLIVTG